MGGGTYELISAHDSHHAQRLHTMICRMEGGVSGLRAVISEYDVGDEVCVEILHVFAILLRVLLHGGFEGCFRLRVFGGSAAAVDRSTLQTVAVDVHVGELGVVAVEVDDAGLVVLTVCEGFVEWLE